MPPITTISDSNSTATGTATSTSYDPYQFSYFNKSSTLSAVSSLNDYLTTSSFLDSKEAFERTTLIWTAITDETLPEISQEDLIKILEMVKSEDSESVLLGFRMLQGFRLPKQDFIAQLIMRDACKKLVRILHEQYT